MKKIKILLAALIVTGLAASCSDDDGGSAISGDVNGKWTPTKTVLKVGTNTFTEPYEENEANCEKDYVEFATGGVLNNVIYFRNASNACTPDAATPASWSRADDMLTITGGEYSGTYEIIRLSNSDLQVREETTTGGITTTATIYLKKV